MSEARSASTFVVVTGDPQLHRSNQLSKIRSHVATRLHQQSRAKARKAGKSKPAQQVEAFQSLHNVLGKVPQEISLRFTPPQLPSSAIGQKRMQQFMYEYVQFSQQLHPFFSTVVCASVSNPALMSSKILNASAWDDLNLTGEVGDLTLQQGKITRRLLNDSIDDGNPWDNVAVATLVAVIIFDLVNDDQDAFRHDLQGLVMILTTRAGALDLGFEGHLWNSLFLIDELQRAVHINSTIFPSEIYALPLAATDMIVFTLWSGEGLFRDHDNIQTVIPFLHRLYDAVMSAGQRQWTSHDSQEFPPHDYTPDTGHFPHSTKIMYDGLDQCFDTRILVLHHATELVRRFLAGFAIDIHAIQNLQSMLQNTDLRNFWGSLPGALIWCLAIGTRFAPPSHLRKWFMMQMTRSTCALAMGLFDEVLHSVKTVLDALDRIGVNSGGLSGNVELHTP